MSWDAWIKKLLDHEEIDDAAIWGFDGTPSKWASSPGLEGIMANEIKALLGDLSGAYTTGIHLAGRKCTILRNELNEESSRSLSVNMKTEGETFAVCICKTEKAFVIAKGAKDRKAGMFLLYVADLAKSLTDLKY